MDLNQSSWTINLLVKLQILAMPDCLAPNCFNSTTKGYLMEVFPQDAQCRVIWTTNVWGENRILQKEYRLCEVC